MKYKFFMTITGLFYFLCFNCSSLSGKIQTGGKTDVRDLKSDTKVIPRKKEPLPVSKTLSVPEWEGDSFILLKKMRFFRKFGYHLYTSPLLEEESSWNNKQYVLQNHRIRYSVFSGKIIKAVDVKKQKHSDYIVTFECDTPNLNLYGKTKNGSIEDIALFDDIISAEKRWIGKEIYSRRRVIQEYDTASGKFSQTKVSILEPLKVVRVTPGISPMPPKSVWLYVQTKEKTTGIIPLHFSWTNVPFSKRKDYIPWKDDLFESPPDSIYQWPEETWKIIDQHKIFTGMTTDQVRISWGEPDKEEIINNNKESEKFLMIYERGQLVFENDTLVNRK